MGGERKTYRTCFGTSAVSEQDHRETLRMHILTSDMKDIFRSWPMKLCFFAKRGVFCLHDIVKVIKASVRTLKKVLFSENIDIYHIDQRVSLVEDLFFGE
jgi:hypothetical protein